ncbi:MAG: AAA family ATPase [Nitrospirae bacterium]|nr:AAA family ATPase [Nitrospirota bacterium]
MIISHIKLKNWKNFTDVDIDLKDRMFLVGPNASGKSNLIDAFRFLRDIAKDGGGLQQAITDRGGISKIRCLSDRGNTEITIKIHLSEVGSPNPKWKYEIVIDNKTVQDKYILRHERVWKGEELIVDRPNEKDKKNDKFLEQTFLEQKNASEEFWDIVEYLEKIHYQHLLPQFLQYPQAFSGSELSGDPFGRGFLERLSKTPEKTRKSRLNKIDKALRIAAPQLKELRYSNETGNPHLEAKCIHWRANAARQNEKQFSDGTLRMIGMLWALLEGDGLLLLEEPELSLNAGIIAKLPVIIYKIQKQKKRQVIMTTHSVNLLQDTGISPHEIVILEPDENGTKCIAASSISKINAMIDGGMTLADAIIPMTFPRDTEKIISVLYYL